MSDGRHLDITMTKSVSLTRCLVGHSHGERLPGLRQLRGRGDGQQDPHLELAARPDGGLVHGGVPRLPGLRLRYAHGR